MPHILRLGFKQNPASTDDAIDLGGGWNTGGMGYHLESYQEGEVRRDDYNHLVRDLTIVVGIYDTTTSAVLARYRAINRYIQQTRMFLAPFNGNYTGTTDGTWYQGFCATLTFQPQDATSPIYWDVLSGSVKLTEAFLGPDILGKQIEGVVITLTVRYSARGALVTLSNLVRMGSFELPFTPNDLSGAGSYYNGDWTFTSGAVWFLDTTTGKYGQRSLKWVGASSTTAYTNENTDIYDFSRDTSNNPVYTRISLISASIWLKATGVTGTTTVALEGYVSGSWATLATVASGIGNLADWTMYKVESVSTSTATKVRLKITTPTSGTVYFDGVAIWRSATTPANNEYFTHGLKVKHPSGYLYDAAGDVEAPLILHVGVPTNGSSGPSVQYTNLTVGAREYNPTATGRDSIPGMALSYANGSTNTALFWGRAGQGNTGPGYADFYLQQSSNMTSPVYKVPRKYRVFLAYKTAVAQTSIEIWPYNLPSARRVFTKAIPVSASQKVLELGDWVYPPEGNALQNQIDINVSGLNAIGIGIAITTKPGSMVSNQIEIGGLIMVPYEQYATVDAVSGYGGIMFSSMADPESGSVRTMQGDYATYNPYYTQELGTGQTDNSDVLQVIPGAMQFEILAFASRDATYTDLYTYNGDDLISPTLAYQPRYLSGGL